MTYRNLAYLLERGEEITLLNGEIYTQKKLYLKTIQLNSKDENAYGNLANILENGETVTLLNGEIYTDRELYLKAIQLNPNNEYFYDYLANILEKGEKVEVLDGEIYTKKELYLKAIQLNPNYATAYNNFTTLLEKDEEVKLLNGEVYTKKELYLKAIQLNPKDENAYNNLATLLEKDETVTLLDGRIYTQKELYLKAIQLNSKNEIYYQNLASILEKDEKVTLVEGEIYTQKELYLKAIQLNPNYAAAYNNLVTLLEQDEEVKLLNGEIYTKKELYIKAIQLNPNYAAAYNNLATLLEQDEEVKLLNGEIYTQKELYLKAIQLNSKNEIYYQNLAGLLKNEETVKLLSGEISTKKDLCLKAIHLEPMGIKSARARQYLRDIYIQDMKRNQMSAKDYFDLIAILQRRSIHLDDDTIVDSEFCFKEALQLDPAAAFSLQFATGFFFVASNLSDKTDSFLEELINDFTIEAGPSRARLLNEGASLTLKNGEVLSAKALYQHALPFLSLAYLKQKGDKGVGDYLSSRECIILKDGTKFTKLMAYTYAYQNNPDQHILRKIGDALHPEERILLNGKFYDKRICYEEASSDNRDAITLLKQAESLYSHEYLKKKELFQLALAHAHQIIQDRLETYTILVKVLSQYELTNTESKYLFIFGEAIKDHIPIKCQSSSWPIQSCYESLDSFDISDELYFTKKQEFLLDFLKYRPYCEEAYVALATNFQDALIIHEKSYPSKEALYLKAIDMNPDYSLPYFLLGQELFNQQVENIQLLNGVTLSCKQLLMRCIQLGTYEARAYHLAALMMHDREGIHLFDGKTILSRGDLFIRAFELDFTRIMDLKNFIAYTKRRHPQLSVDN